MFNASPQEGLQGFRSSAERIPAGDHLVHDVPEELGSTSESFQGLRLCPIPDKESQGHDDALYDSAVDLRTHLIEAIAFRHLKLSYLRILLGRANSESAVSVAILRSEQPLPDHGGVNSKTFSGSVQE